MKKKLEPYYMITASVWPDRGHAIYDWRASFFDMNKKVHEVRGREDSFEKAEFAARAALT